MCDDVMGHKELGLYAMSGCTEITQKKERGGEEERRKAGEEERRRKRLIQP